MLNDQKAEAFCTVLNNLNCEKYALEIIDISHNFLISKMVLEKICNLILNKFIKSLRLLALVGPMLNEEKCKILINLVENIIN